MTDDVTGSDPTSPPPRSWRIPVLVGALVIVIVVVVALVVGRGDDGSSTDASSDPTSTSTSSTPTAASTSASPSTSGSASASASPEADPTPSPIVNKAVKAAIQDDFPALVPAGVPAGWTVVSAAYDGKAHTWRIDLTDPSGGEVVLVQAEVPVDELVTEHLGPNATAEGKVDLSDYGTGVWKGYAGMDSHGIAKKLSNTSALVYATTQEIAVTLAQELLTAEEGGTSDGG